jgi:hypothetical protein
LDMYTKISCHLFSKIELLGAVLLKVTSCRPNLSRRKKAQVKCNRVYVYTTLLPIFVIESLRDGPDLKTISLYTEENIIGWALLKVTFCTFKMLDKGAM